MKPSTTAKNILVLLLGVGLVLALEGALALFGVMPLAEDDRFAGFSGSSPVFLPRQEGGNTIYELNPAKDRYFNPQSFRMPKPPGTFRVIAFGGSTTYGRPYLNDTSFPTWLAKLLGYLDPDLRYESINLGGISYASYRVRRLMDEAAGYDPDLFVVYSGHNEFLEARTFEKLIEEPPALRRARGVLHRSRLYSSLFRLTERARSKSDRPKRPPLGEEVAARLEEIGGPELYHRDPEFHAGVVRQYRESVESIVRFCQQRDIPLVLCTLPSNLAGVSPFKSEHRQGLDGERLAQWTQLFSQAEAALERDDAQTALERIDRALALDDRYAAAHYLRGTALRRLGRFDAAYRALLRAKQEDIVPLRALEEFNATLRQVAATRGVPLADVEARFRRESPNGIPGPELFADHVHPTLKGQQLIAWVVAETAARAGVVPATAATWQNSEAALLELLAAEYAKISDRYRAMGLWGVGRLYHWAGKYPEARQALRRAWETVKDVAEIPQLLGELELARGNPQQALAYYRAALAIAPGDKRSRYGIVKAQLALGDGPAALEALPRKDPGQASAMHTLLLGEAQLLTGDAGEALTNIGAAAQMAPEVQRFQYALARARAATGDEPGARQAFSKYLKLAGRPWSETEFAALLGSVPGTAPPH